MNAGDPRSPDARGAAGHRAGPRPVIVIFGCAVRRGGVPSEMLRHRVEAAAAFGRTLPDPLYVPTGGIGRHPPSEAEVMARSLMRDHGVRPDAIRREETARDTMMSVRAVAAMLRGTMSGTRPGDPARATSPVFAMSSGFHQPRCVILLRLAGLPARFCPPPPAAPRLLARWYWRLREALALPYDVAIILSLRVLGRV